MKANKKAPARKVVVTKKRPPKKQSPGNTAGSGVYPLPEAVFALADAIRQQAAAILRHAEAMRALSSLVLEAKKPEVEAQPAAYIQDDIEQEEPEAYRYEPVEAN